MTRLRPGVRAALVAHAVEPGESDTPARLRERLDEVYLEEVRKLRARQRAGEIPLHEYAARVDLLKRSFPLLGLPLELWTDAPLSD